MSVAADSSLNFGQLAGPNVSTSPSAVLGPRELINDMLVTTSAFAVGLAADFLCLRHRGGHDFSPHSHGLIEYLG